MRLRSMLRQWTIYPHLTTHNHSTYVPTIAIVDIDQRKNKNECSKTKLFSASNKIPAAPTAMDGITTPCFEADLRPEDWEITFSRRVFKVGTGRKTRWAHFWLDSLWPYLFLRGPWQFLAERGRKTFYPPPPKQVVQNTLRELSAYHYFCCLIIDRE